MHERHLVITGADGSGKSSVLQTVSAQLHSKSIHHTLISIWDPLAASPLFSDKRGVDQYLISLDPPARACFIFHCYYESLRQARAKAQCQSSQDALFIHDSYFHKYLVMESGWGAQTEWLAQVCALFPKPDAVLELTVSPNIASQRKIKTSCYEQGPEKNFPLFQQKLSAIWELVRKFEIQRGTSWQQVSTDQSALPEVCRLASEWIEAKRHP